jgi:hypothetical protein
MSKRSSILLVLGLTSTLCVALWLQTARDAVTQRLYVDTTRSEEVKPVAPRTRASGERRPEQPARPTVTSDSTAAQWSELDPGERIERALAAFEHALVVVPADIEAATDALSMLRPELYPARVLEYQQLEQRLEDASDRASLELRGR